VPVIVVEVEPGGVVDFMPHASKWTAAARASQAWMLTSSSQSLTFVSTLLAVAWGGDRLAKSLDRGTRSGVNPARQVDLRVFRIQASEPNVRRVKKGPPISIVVVSSEPLWDFFQSKDFIKKKISRRSKRQRNFAFYFLLNKLHKT
jgi:hypothetical protein